jgi:hypothetical protein
MAKAENEKPGDCFGPLYNLFTSIRSLFITRQSNAMKN